MMGMDIFEELARLRRQGEWCALATVVHASGSTPGAAGARLLLRGDGTMAGTIGGGRVEAEVVDAARQVLAERQSRRMNFTLSGADENSLLCGGELEVFVEPIEPPARLYLFGAGHVGLSVCRVAAEAGFLTTVLDDRADYATRERFPEADAVRAGDYDELFAALDVNPSSYIVIVTSSHQSDRRVLRRAIESGAAYVAMIGSRRKVAETTRALMAEGIAEERFARLSAPMGLEIGAVTPGEIAVSVVAEMIAVRRGAGHASSKSVFAAGVAQA
jgi:xanthine dehydrogenase accessory factor